MVALDEVSIVLIESCSEFLRLPTEASDGKHTMRIPLWLGKPLALVIATSSWLATVSTNCISKMASSTFSVAGFNGYPDFIIKLLLYCHDQAKVGLFCALKFTQVGELLGLTQIAIESLLR